MYNELVNSLLLSVNNNFIQTGIPFILPVVVSVFVFSTHIVDAKNMPLIK